MTPQNYPHELRKERCTARPRANDLEQPAWEAVPDMLTHADKLQAEVRAKLASDAADEVEAGIGLAHIKRPLAAKQAERERAIELARRGILSLEETERGTAKVRDETDALQRRLEELSDLSEHHAHLEKQREALATFALRVRDL